MSAPAIPLAAAFVLGLAFGCRLSDSLWPQCIVVGLLLAGALVLCRKGLALASTLSVLVAYVLLGGVAEDAHRSRATPSITELHHELGEKAFVTPRYIEGRLMAAPQSRPRETVLLIDVRRVRLAAAAPRAWRVHETNGRLPVSVRGDYRHELDDLAPGDSLAFWAALRVPKGARNPGGLDLSRASPRGLFQITASVKSAYLIERQKAAPAIAVVWARLRTLVTRRLERAFHRPEERECLGIELALLTGDRSRVPEATSRLYRDAGIYHVLAISGAHVAVLALLLHGGLRRLGLDERPSLWMLLSFLPAYALFCGARASVLRAVIMASFVIGARLLSLPGALANALAAALLLLLCLDPKALWDVGFQLTFAATATIVALAPSLQDSLRPRLKRFAGPLAVALAAQIGVLPLSAIYFQRLSLVAPFAGLLAIPLAAAALVSALATSLFTGLPVLGFLSETIARSSVTLMRVVAETALAIPGAAVRVPSPTPIWVVSFLIALVVYRSSRLRVVSIVSLALLVAGLAIPLGTETRRDFLELTLIDVGHGDAMLLTLPGGQRVLVDSGGSAAASYDVGERVVLPFLLNQGVRRLDAAVVTHGDFDHAGGLSSVLAAIPVGMVLEGPFASERAAYQRVRETGRALGLPFRKLYPGQRFSWGGVSWQVLAAGGRPGFTTRTRENDRSLVLRLRVGSSTLLLTGDAERVIEDRLLRDGMDLRADVLKVAHHGSATSTSPAFLEAVRPRVALISTRKVGRRPLPSTRVLERLRRRGVDVLRTDLGGAITVRLFADGGIDVVTHRESSR